MGLKKFVLALLLSTLFAGCDAAPAPTPVKSESVAATNFRNQLLWEESQTGAKCSLHFEDATQNPAVAHVTCEGAPMECTYMAYEDYYEFVGCTKKGQGV